MRLVCPNCDAEYEVDDAAIPQGGRDVQCSNCGHAWFQAHPEVEAEQEAEEALYEPPVAPVAAAVVADEGPAVTEELDSGAEPAVEAEYEPEATEPVAEVAVEDPVWPSTPEAAVAATLSMAAALPEPATPPLPPAAAPQPPRRGLDESLLAVLREEATRESDARQAEAPRLETQTDMGLEDETEAPASGLAAAVKRIARLKGVPEPEPPSAPKTRGDMLPAIDEINSTLRATSDRHSDEDNVILETMEDLNQPAKSGFRRGFMTLLILALIIVALYLAAPLISARFPAVAPYLDNYVSIVDGVRLWVDAGIKSLIAKLRGMEGGQAG